MKNENVSRSWLLWIVFSVLTVSIMFYTLTGWWMALEFGLTSLSAVCCWLKFSFRQGQVSETTTPLYILAITILLILDTTRFASEYPEFIRNKFQGSFGDQFSVTPASWFVLIVCLPVSIMLAGGYLLIKKHITGYFFAWWTFIYALTESIVQFTVELLHQNDYAHHYFAAVWVAIILFLICTYGIVGIIKSRPGNSKRIAFVSSDPRRINLWTIMFVSLVMIYAITLYTQAGILPVGVVAGSMMGGIIGWRKTTARFPADPYKLVPLYLLLQSLFFVHVGEETLTHFNRGIAAISGHQWNDTSFSYIITLIGPIIWVFAAWSLWKGQAFGNFILWFMIVGMIVGEPTHILVFPVIRMIKEGIGYQYFSGMYTSLFPMIPAILALTVIISDHKKRKASNA